MDTFSDVEIFCDILEATRKRNVYVYLLLDHTNLQLFQDMCENVKINKSHLSVSYSILVRAFYIKDILQLLPVDMLQNVIIWKYMQHFCQFCEKKQKWMNSLYLWPVCLCLSSSLHTENVHS